MSVVLVLDASALLAVTLLEPGGDFVLTQMHSAESTVIYAANVFEVVYKLMIRGVPEDIAWRSATYGGATIVEDMGETIAARAVRIKMGALHLSMADCYCLALAEMVDGKVLTSDKGFGSTKTTANVVIFR
jgi:PIN domain nuclease of toxin-antitoxin system